MSSAISPPQPLTTYNPITQSGDAAEVNMGTWIPCRIRTTLTTGNMVVRIPRYTVVPDALTLNLLRSGRRP